MSSEADKKITEHFLQGSWCNDTKENDILHTIIVSINNGQLSINWFIANIYKEGLAISSNAHWYGDYLVFTERQKYFVKVADKEHLICGEFNQAGKYTEVKWEKEFKRMAEA